MHVVSTRISHTVSIAACICLSSCLYGRGVGTENLSAVYVPPDAAEQHLVIAGTTATVPHLKPFVIDDPIAYDMETTCGNGSLIESKTYTNTDGDEIRFRTKRDNRTGESWQSVVVHPAGDDEYELMRLPGYLCASRAKAHGIDF
jgi:hypothetical protein